MRGFTLIELLVAMAMMAVLLFFALPAFNEFTTQRRVTANVNSLVSAISYARSEAMRRGGIATLQARDGDDDTNEWGPGFCVNAENPGDCDDPLQVFTVERGTSIDAVDGLDGVDALTFNSRGLLQGGISGSIRVCGGGADEDPGRTVNINTIGRATVRDLICFP